MNYLNNFFTSKYHFEVQNISSFTRGMKMCLCFLLIITGIILSGQNTALAQITINKSVAASTDDAEQQGPDGSVPGGMFLNDMDLELVRDVQFPGYGTQKVGMRFLGINIPQGATITGAFLTFRAVAPDAPMTNSEATNLTFNGQLIANAPTFTSTNNNIGSRTLTSASATWAPSAWTTGANINSPSMVSIIQEIVNQGTWVSGNALAIIVSGSGHRSAASWDGDNVNAPKLTITYTTTPPIVLSTSVTNVLCRGNATGAINLSVTGGIAPYTYDWSNNGITSPGSYPDPQDISGLIAGSYLVNVKDAAGTTASLTVSVTQPGAALALSTVVSNVTSPGGSNGAIDLTPSGGTPGYTYAWTGGATTQDRSGLVAGTYTVTVTDANTCTSTISSTVIESINQTLVNKQLYLDGTLGLSRDNPANPADPTTATTATLGVGNSIISLDATSSGVTTSTTATISHTTSTNANRLMLVGISLRPRDNETVSSITYGGTALTLVAGPISNGSNARIYIYRLLSPASGTANVVVTFNNATDKGAVIGVTTYSGVNQTTPLGTFVSATGSSNAPSVNVSSASGELVFDVLAVRNTTALTPGAGQTERWDINSNEIRGGGSTEPGSVTTTMNWTSGNAAWAIGGVSIKPATSLSTVTFTESPTLCSALTIKAGQTIKVETYLNIISGSMPANPTLSAVLRRSGTVIATLTNPTFSGGLLTWTGSIGSDVTATAGQSIELVVTTTQAGVTFQIRYDSQTYPSKITLPVSTFINVNSLQVFSAAYPNGSVISNVPNSGTSYVRIAVSDPFGTADINGVNLTLTKPDGATINAILGASNVVHTAGCVKTYQYSFVNPVDLGSWDITAVAKEGTEGTVTHSQSATVTVIIPTGPVTQIKPLYFNDALGLDRSNPANPVDNTTAQTGLLASTSSGTATITTSKATILYEGANTRNFGSCTVIGFEPDAGFKDHSLVEFDLSSIPTGATITSASLRLVHQVGSFGEGGDPFTVNVRRLTRAWVEGTACDANQAGSATWNSAGATNWTTAGGDFAATNYGSFTGGAADPNGTVYTVNVLTLVNEWFNGTFANNGIILQPSTDPNGGDEYWYVASDDFATFADRLQLIVNYTLPSTTSVTFTQAPTLCSLLTIKKNETISVSAYVSIVNGSMPATPNITAALRYGATNIISMSAPSYISGTGIITWTGTIGADVTVPASQALALDITTAQSGVSFIIDYDSQTKPSKIDLPVSTYIDITAMDMYNAAYPGGSITTNANNGATVYLKATVTDPFGFNDITGFDIAILNPNQTTTNVFGTQVATAGCSKTYQYIWNSPAIPGDYSFTGTAKEGTENTVIDLDYLNFSLCPITVVATLINQPSCNVPNDGVIDLSITGGDGPYTYSWTRTSPAGSGSGTGETISGLLAGTYTFNVTSAGGCIGSTSIVIDDPSGPVLNTNPFPASCLGNDGSIDLTPTTGTGPFTYFWNDGITTQNRTNLVPNFYSVTVTDQDNGCISSTTVEVQSSPGVDAAIVKGDILCFGETNGFINLTPTGGSGIYTFAWAGGATTEDRANLAAGTYSVTINDDAGCVGNLNIIVSGPQDLVITPTLTQPTCFSAGELSISIAGGTAPFTYDWAHIPGSLNSKDVSGLIPGTYTVTVSDANGCKKTGIYTVNTPVCTPSIIQVCTSNTTDVYSVDFDADVTSYIWTVPAGAVIASGQGTRSIVVNWSGASEGLGDVCVKSLNTCGESVDKCQQVSIRNLVPSIIAQPACIGGNLFLNGIGALTYLWAVPSGFTSTLENPSIMGLTIGNSGTYSVTATDSYGCVGTSSINITLLQAPTVSTAVTEAVCGGQDGSINLTPTGGTAPYTYMWSNFENREDIFNLKAGIYSVIVSDANGCTVSESVEVNNFPAQTVSLLANPVGCFGGSTGAITTTVSGGTAPFTYFWADGSTTPNRSGIPAGQYSVEVTGDDGCIGVGVVEVLQASEMIVSSTKLNVTCFNGTNGNIDVTVSGGTAPYSYAWTTTGGTGIVAGAQDQSALRAGTYTVVVTDANLCEMSLSVEITQPSEALAVTVTNTNISCNGSTDGSIVLNATGGTGPYTFDWADLAPASDPKDRSSLGVNTYSVTITDNNGCTVSATTAITQPTVLTLSNTTVNVSCNAGTNGSIDLQVSGATAPYTFAWSNGATTQDLTDLAAGSYSVSVTDANECVSNATSIITEPATLEGVATATETSCFGSSNGNINLMVTGGNPTPSFLWSNGETTQNISGLIAGLYSVTITDSKGCVAFANATVTEPEKMAVSAAVTQVLCNGDSTGAINITVSGRTSPYTYDWDDIGGTIDIKDRTGLAAGSYSVTINDSNNCSSTATFSITEASAVTMAMVNTSPTCFNANNGSILLNISGGNSPYSFLWSNGATTKDINNLDVGVYAVTATDNNGCISTLASSAITQPSEINVSFSSVNNSCFQGASGSLVANATGGTGAYSYLWSNGATTQIINSLTSGSYTVEIKDDNSCITSSSQTITEPSSAIELFAETTQTSCAGINGAINLTVTGGGTTYSYLWSNGPTTQDISSLAVGSYTITVTDNLGCESISNFSITESAIFTASAEGFETNCAGDNGSATAIYSNGIAPYTYSWSTSNGSASANVATTQTISNLKAGTYSVTITEGNGCLATATVVVNPSPINCNPPIAKNDVYFTPFNTSLTGTVAPVSLSDPGYDSDTEDPLTSLQFFPLTVIDPLKGSIVWDPSDNGTFEFIPASGFTGSVSVNYQVCDLTNLCSPAILTITVQATQDPEVKLVKTASTAGSGALGDVITYTFNVTNTGNVPLNSISIADAKLGLTALAVSPSTLAPNGVGAATATYNITQADLDSGEVKNSAIVSGTPPSGPTVSDVSDNGDELVDTDEDPDTDPTNDPTVVPLTLDPKVKLVKIASLAGSGAVGDVITYTFTVTNTGNVTLSALAIADAKLNLINLAVSPAILAPNGVGTATATYTIVQADLDSGEVKNSAIVTGTPPSGPTVSDVSDNGDELVDTDEDPDTDPTNDPTVVPLTLDPKVKLVKTASLAGSGAVGDVITYTFTVTNTGNVTLSALAIADAKLNLTNLAVSPAILAPNGVGTATATYAIGQADLDSGEVKNSAIVTGTPPNGPTVSDVSDSGDELVDTDEDPDTNPTNDPTVVPLTLDPKVKLVKIASLAGSGAVGDVITYTFTVTNTGNVTLSALAIADAKLNLTNLAVSPAILAPNGVGTATATYTIGQADLDSSEVKNSATVTGTPPSGPTVSDVSDSGDELVDTDEDPDTDPTNDPTVVPLTIDPKVKLVKTASLAGSGALGDVITYTFTVTNTGNVTLSSLAIADAKLNLTNLAVSPSTLTPNGVGTATATYAIGQADLDSGEVKNLPTLTGTPPSGPTVSDVSDNGDELVDTNEDPDTDPTNDPTIVLLTPTPKAKLVKTASLAGTGAFGDVITYTFTVTNTGNVTLSALAIADAKLNLTNLAVSPAILAPNGVGTATATYNIAQADLDSGEVKNSAIVTGTPPSGPTVSDVSDNGDELVDTDEDPDTDPTNDPTVVYFGPIANSNSANAVPSGSLASLGNILSNDKKRNGIAPLPIQVTVDLDLSLPGEQSSLVVPGEGTWNYNPATGVASFEPLVTFKLDPNPIIYNLTEIATGKSDTAKLFADYIPVTTDDIDTYEPGLPKTVNVLINDTDGDSIASNSIELLAADAGSNGKIKTVVGQGIWSANLTTGSITFTPEIGFINNPNPIFYIGKDNEGNVSNSSELILTAILPPLVDVELTKTSNVSCQVQVDDIVVFTVKVFRKDNSTEMVNLNVRDSLTSNLSYVSHSISQGSFNSTTGLWSGISIGRGDTATLQMHAKVLTSIGGLACNTAWVQSQDKADVDSQGGNQNVEEDDMAKVCVSIPMLLCSARSEKIVLFAPTGYTNYIWKRNGTVILGENLNTYQASESGSYTVEVLNFNPCGLAGCCPIVISDYCECNNEIWVPINIHKTK